MFLRFLFSPSAVGIVDEVGVEPPVKSEALRAFVNCMAWHASCLVRRDGDETAQPAVETTFCHELAFLLTLTFTPILRTALPRHGSLEDCGISVV